MRDFSGILEVREAAAEQANELLSRPEWSLLEVAPGQDADRRPCFLYSLGREYREPGPEWE